MSGNPYAYPPEHRRYDPGDPHGRKLDGDFRKRLDRALDRQLALENQVRAVLADYPISDQVQGCSISSSAWLGPVVATISRR